PYGCTSVCFYPARPAKFRIVAHEPDGRDLPLRFVFNDSNRDGTLSSTADFVDIATYTPATLDTPQVTWRVQPVSTGTPPGPGDVWQLRLAVPFGDGDVFAFTTTGEHVDARTAAA